MKEGLLSRLVCGSYAYRPKERWHCSPIGGPAMSSYTSRKLTGFLGILLVVFFWPAASTAYGQKGGGGRGGGGGGGRGGGMGGGMGRGGGMGGGMSRPGGMSGGMSRPGGMGSSMGRPMGMNPGGPNFSPGANARGFSLPNPHGPSAPMQSPHGGPAPQTVRNFSKGELQSARGISSPPRITTRPGPGMTTAAPKAPAVAPKIGTILGNRSFAGSTPGVNIHTAQKFSGSPTVNAARAATGARGTIAERRAVAAHTNTAVAAAHLSHCITPNLGWGSWAHCSSWSRYSSWCGWNSLFCNPGWCLGFSFGCNWGCPGWGIGLGLFAPACYSGWGAYDYTVPWAPPAEMYYYLPPAPVEPQPENKQPENKQPEKLPPPVPTAARITFHAPVPDAQVWMDDYRTVTRGEKREFESPLLQPGKKYTYRLVVIWEDAGQIYRDERVVDVAAGSEIEVDYRTVTK